MKSLNPYINFSGKCREALEFYKKCLNGEITLIQTFGEAPVGADEKDKQNIMHAEFKAEAIHFMATDGMPGHIVTPGDNISLALQFTDEKDQETVFNALAAGGKITQPLEYAFWGARFGMLVDRYGIHWMLNCAKQ